ncbi:MAG TPA: hypothetical protein VK465_07495 [Fibrobacteria bacterium]|nr:hypothetical protein [Fibrobacteria bacterium]
MDTSPIRAALAALCMMVLAALSPDASAKTAVLLPLRMDPSQIKDHQAIRDFYADALSMHYPGTLKQLSGDTTGCAERACAAEAAKLNGADEAVFGSVRMLGRKMFFSSSIVAADGGDFFTQQIGVANVEDFENATKRMAEALSKRQGTEQVASIENITEKEDNLEVNRRRHFYSSGGSLGMAFPVGNSYQRWVRNSRCDDYYETCGPEDEHLRKYTQVVKLGWNNWFEFKNRLAMEIDVLFYAPIALGTDVNLVYMLGNGDITPFAGGGLGMHYVFPDEGTQENEEKTNLGPAGNFQAGLIFFRTYNLNLIVRGQYHTVKNDDWDNGPSVDVALRTKVGGGGNDKYHRTSATTWLGVGVGIAYLIAILIGASNS